MMQAHDLLGYDLEWVQPNSFKMQYELRAGEEPAATLRFRSSWGSLATGEIAAGCWTFKRVGFWQPRLTIRVCGETTDVAVFRNNTWKGGGTLEFPDGRVWRASTNFWQSNLEFANEAGEPLIHFRRGGLVHLSARVEIAPGGAAAPELPLLLLFGWYVLVLMYMDSVAVSVSVAAVS